MVSVIVPIYNGEADLPGLIACLLAQTYPADRVEYLLVDNASYDRTPDLLQTAATQAKAQGITLRPLSEADIQSSYAARNTGIRAATGEILAFTDADCYPEPDWLKKLVPPFQDPAVGLVAGGINALPGKTWLEKYAERKGLLRQQDTLAHPFCPYGQTANLAIRVAALPSVGLFRPYLTTGGDADMCWRLQRQGDWQLVFAEEAVIRHRHRTSLKELRSQWRRYGTSNRYLHDLHGVNLAHPISAYEVRYQLGRWLLKDLPKATIKLLLRRGPGIDLVMTPVGLYCGWMRTQGQQQAQLPDNARQIPPWPAPSSISAAPPQG
jgi:cellulose synthase/poly-beta-1,6-N-acetylglucosamine synthase-like glycosyltransferase